MRVSALKTQRRVETTPWRSYGIETYGKDNDYPQRVDEVVKASTTGRSCLAQYGKFIMGRGFAQADFFKAVINSRGQETDTLLALVADDLAEYHGFALHANWNMAGQITEVNHVPFEFVRKGLRDSDREGWYAIHDDWGKRNTAVKRFKADDIKWVRKYNPDTMRDEAREDGWENYNGQLLYVSLDGRDCYPVPVYDAALTDMSTEEGLANVALRNVRNNFLPAGMLIDRNNPAPTKEEERETKDELSEFQGDTNAGKLFYVNLAAGDQEPEFKPFNGANFDKAFSLTNEVIPQRIGRAFNQPPILRSEDVGANFGADLMHNAYDYYNSITENERMEVERVFAEVFSRFAENVNPDADYRILAKQYRVNETLADRLGDNTDKVVELLFNESVKPEAKAAILAKVYGLDEDDINTLISTL